MYLITPENFDDDGAISLEASTLDFVRKQADVVDGDESAVSLNPVMRFYGQTESEALGLAATWAQSHVDGEDIVVLATWFRFLEDEDDRPYEACLVLAVA
jgi:hypothetical protein